MTRVARSVARPVDLPRPSCSIVIPARNAAETLPATLEALRDLPAGWDVIVVNDHSTDATAEVAASFGVRVIGARGSGVSAARNTGARAARGAVLAFLDADVVARPEAVEEAVLRVALEEADCVFAVYDEGRHLDDAVSAYKNFWIRCTTLRAPRPLHWVNTSLAVMRRADFTRAGGFHADFTVRRGGGDVDIGRRLAASGLRIVADAGVEVAHNKRFHLRRLMRNDFNRARGWLRLALRQRGWAATVSRPGLANVVPAFTLGALATVLGLVLLAGSPWRGALLWPGLAAVALGLGANGRFLFAAARARVHAWPLFPLLLVFDQVACVAGVVTELGAQATGRIRRRR